MENFEGRIVVIYEIPFTKKWKWKFFQSLLRKGSRTKKILFDVRKNLQKKPGWLLILQNFWLKLKNSFQTKTKENHKGWFWQRSFWRIWWARATCACASCAHASCARAADIWNTCVSYSQVLFLNQCSSLDHLGVWRNTIHDLNPPISFSISKIVRIW